jgi:hypothetical protein
MRAALAPLSRYIATSLTAKHRFFVWLAETVTPDCQLIVVARDDDYYFGVLHAKAHTAWAARAGGTLEDRPRYNPTTCFETFPFPTPTEDQRAAIAAAAAKLHETRQSALDQDPALTLTALYNKRPTWLDNLHRALDAAVLDAYGWPADIGDEELLTRLLALNLERAAEETQGIVRRP